MANPLNEVLTTTEAGSLWGLQPDTVKRAALEGRLEARKSGWVWLTTREAMERTYGKMAALEVKIKKEDGKAHCPICGTTGEYKAGGGKCEHQWVWDETTGRLVAVPKR